MDKRKIGWILMLFAGGMLAVFWWINSPASKSKPTGGQPPPTQPVAAAPASRPATRPATAGAAATTQPVAGGPTTAGATTLPALFFVDGGEKALRIGSQLAGTFRTPFPLGILLGQPTDPAGDDGKLGQ